MEFLFTTNFERNFIYTPYCVNCVPTINKNYTIKIITKVWLTKMRVQIIFVKFNCFNAQFFSYISIHSSCVKIIWCYAFDGQWAFWSFYTARNFDCTRRNFVCTTCNFSTKIYGPHTRCENWYTTCNLDRTFFWPKFGRWLFRSLPLVRIRLNF